MGLTNCGAGAQAGGRDVDLRQIHPLEHLFDCGKDNFVNSEANLMRDDIPLCMHVNLEGGMEWEAAFFTPEIMQGGVFC